MSRTAALDDAAWAWIEPLLPSSVGCPGRPCRDLRRVFEGIIYRFRTGVPWRDLPATFGPWRTVWKRHRRFSLDGAYNRLLTELQVQADAAGELDWQVFGRLHHRSGASARCDGAEVGPRGRPRTQGVPSNDKNPTCGRTKRDDHGIGCSRGGLTTTTHALVDGRCRPLVIACTPGQAGDSPALPLLLTELRVPRRGPGRPRTTPDGLLADKAYSARAHRQKSRSRGITAVNPGPANQIGHRIDGHGERVHVGDSRLACR